MKRDKLPADGQSIVKISVIHATEFLVATPHGRLDRASSQSLLQGIIAATNETSSYPLLLDLRTAEFFMSAADVYDWVAELSEFRLAFSNRIAALTRAGTHPKNLDLFELCATNRGIRTHVFEDYGDAIAWLMSATEVWPPANLMPDT